MTVPGARLAVVYGGPSAEAAVSKVSAEAVFRALLGLGYEVNLLELGPNLAAELVQARVDAVVPATHGAMGEDGCLQGLLEVLGVPYSGSAVLASALAAHKGVAKRVFANLGLPVAHGREVSRASWRPELAAELRRELGPAVVVKPCSGGSAIGIGRIRETDPDARLNEALEVAFEVDPAVVVECFRTGDEVTCGVLEDALGTAVALPPTRILSKAADWYDFTSRYGTGGSEHQCPAPYAPALIARIQEVAVAAHTALGARDLSRVDFVVASDSGEVTLLEVNTLPGMTPTSLFPEAAAIAGIDFATLCDRLATRALARAQARHRPAVRAMPA